MIATIEGWKRIELARLYGSLRLVEINLKWKEKSSILMDEEKRELADITSALARLSHG